VGSLASAAGYFKATNTEEDDRFGGHVALSGDGTTLAVGASDEDSGATGFDGDQSDNSTEDAGAVYVFVRHEAGSWTPQAYIKASYPGEDDGFGTRLALSTDGRTLAITAYREDSNSTGINGDPDNDTATNSGAAYVFVRDDADSWTQQAYIKASNAEEDDWFGRSVSLSGSGDTLAVGAAFEDSGATGVDGDQEDNSADAAGAAYVFVRDDAGSWSQQAYIKASNAQEDDVFGRVALSTDGNTLAVSSPQEDSGATGIDGDQDDNSAIATGATYIFVRDDASTWSQQAYIKASNAQEGDEFGFYTALNGDGNTLAVSAWREDSHNTGINGSETGNSAADAGAVYVFTRDAMGTWSQQAYLKASNTDAIDRFGMTVDLSADGSTLAVSAAFEDSGGVGVNPIQDDNSVLESGAVYVFVRGGDEMNTWVQWSYVKATNPDADDVFGIFGSVALSDDGNTLAVGAIGEASNATGVGGSQADNSAPNAGAVYLF
ncbi:MAG: FG-GAP repeat protein, partial [Deltaproteobacteria bacterium]|nr:FG-GAP repeat protein [Deltaproteobacteria bacterium]